MIISFYFLFAVIRRIKLHIAIASRFRIETPRCIYFLLPQQTTDRQICCDKQPIVTLRYARLNKKTTQLGYRKQRCPMLIHKCRAVSVRTAQHIFAIHLTLCGLTGQPIIPCGRGLWRLVHEKATPTLARLSVLSP